MKGAPLYLLCPTYRKLPLGHRPTRHELLRTGKVRAHRSNRYAATRRRQSYEIVCSTCGYHGWTNHPDAEHLRVNTGDVTP